jgi:purine-binding chemotaxis protein CheW
MFNHEEPTDSSEMKPLVDKDEAPLSIESLISKIDSAMQTDLAYSEPLPSGERGPSRGSIRPRDQYVRFSLEDALFAIPLSNSLEVAYLPDVTSLPNLPVWVLGVSNIRGEIISVVDLKRLFGWPSVGPRKRDHLILVHNKKLKIGITVDRVMRILSLEQGVTDLANAQFEREEVRRFLRGYAASEQRITYILDVDVLLSPNVLDPGAVAYELEAVYGRRSS